jgi:hypothetical protein
MIPLVPIEAMDKIRQRSAPGWPRHGVRASASCDEGASMSIIADVSKELLGMFLADARLTTATLILVAIVAALVIALQVEPLLGGGLLLLGCLAILVEAAAREAARRNSS